MISRWLSDLKRSKEKYKSIATFLFLSGVCGLVAIIFVIALIVAVSGGLIFLSFIFWCFIQKGIWLPPALVVASLAFLTIAGIYQMRSHSPSCG